MIQRIQTVYLSIAFLALIVLYFLPVASFLAEFTYTKFYITHLASLTPDADPVINDTIILPLGVFNGIIAFIAFFAISLYKKRLLQSKLVKLAILMNIIMISLIFFVYSPLISRSASTDANYAEGWGLYLILLSLFMFILANRAIIKDEKLVRSSDRLR